MPKRKVQIMKKSTLTHEQHIILADSLEEQSNDSEEIWKRYRNSKAVLDLLKQSLDDLELIISDAALRRSEMISELLKAGILVQNRGRFFAPPHVKRSGRAALERLRGKKF